ncbi:MAG: DUF4351 domain-containing protein [Gomphosphaeria aponina SAG 52.96 = DSM 107014]|uniref:DUF4351 domain-containing protein n=1 Tax=Gomphosphaeria aponina SAG 52.96 = DSM 107014 TaxID=1521640 RepID=A0A941JSA2_9CHRO|nr:DUF4351 domain-containing protein [Gomphosphaeria aponina SAG 52.96 = DSM 107014]
MISSDFQWVARENDVLLKVNSPQQGDFLILNELQLRYKKNVPQRINAYTALAIEKYNLPVYPVLINIFPNSKVEKIPHCYQSEFMGIKSYQDYKVINLWEIDAKIVFEQELTTLLPFVPILKGGGDEMVVRQAVQLLRDNEKLEELEPLLSFFASFVLSIPLVQQIMRWDMVVLRESPWYQEILKEGLTRGEKQGIEQGIEQEGIKLVSKLIQRRFGEISPALMLQIQQLKLDKLENLAEELLDITKIEQVEKWLQDNSN